METRANIRKHYKNLRNEMSVEESQRKSVQICERILTSNWYRDAKLILGYYPLGMEADILPVLKHALSIGKRIALPRTMKNCEMDFYEIKNLDTDVMEGAFHIFEPNIACEVIVPSIEKKGAVLALVPGVVFDKAGNRYGYGRGYYDRYFARYHGICRVGIAYDMQIFEKYLEAYPTDIKMHCIVTEKEEIKA